MGGGVHAFGGGSGSCGLGSVLLGIAQLGDGFGERGQTGDEHDRGELPVAGEVGERRQKPGGLAEPVPGEGGRGMCRWGAGSAVVRVGALAQDAAADRGGGHVQCVEGGPGSVDGCSRTSPGQGVDVGGDAGY